MRRRAGVGWIGTQVVVFASPIIAAACLWEIYSRGRAAFDLVHSYLPAAADVLHGRSPYHLTQVAAGYAYAYPPLAAYLTVPLQLLPGGAVPAVGLVLAAASLMLALWLLDVRDGRCYLITLGSPIAFFAVEYANLCLLTALGAAAVWRYRHRPGWAAVLTGLVVAVKLFMWPLLLVPLLTGRVRGAAAAAFVAAVAILLPWAALGFAGLFAYPHLLADLTSRERATSYTVAALIAHRASWGLGQVAVYVLAAAVVAWMVRHRRDERQVFVAALGLCVLMSPIVWVHYFVLLYVALGVTRPRFGPLWMAPLLLWATPAAGNGSTWQLASTLVLVAAIWVRLACSPESVWANPRQEIIHAQVRRRVPRRDARGVAVGG